MATMAVAAGVPRDTNPLGRLATLGVPRTATQEQERPREAVPTVVRQGGARRVNVNFSDEAYDALAQLARQRGKSISDVLRDAIAFEQWYERAHKEGGRVLVERNGKFRELVRF